MILAVDFGRKKTGTAFMDMNIKIPFPCKLIEESNARKVKRALMDIIEEKKIDTVVFGLPLSDDDTWSRGICNGTFTLLLSGDNKGHLYRKIYQVR